jgi:hypothetical protein
VLLVLFVPLLAVVRRVPAGAPVPERTG